MTPSRNAWHERLANLGSFAKAAVLCGALCVLALPMIAIAFALQGQLGVWAALAAMGVCLVAGLHGLLAAGYLQRRCGNYGALVGMFAGMSIRMGMPLLLLLALVLKSHPLLSGGFAYYLIGCYQAMLFVEVLLLLPRTRRAAMP